MNYEEAREVWEPDFERGELHWRESGGQGRKKSVGYLHKISGYWRVVYKQRQYKRARVLWLLHSGEWPKGEIDHVNHIKHEDALCNLRDVTPSENQHNRSLNSNSSTGHAGIYFNETFTNGRRYFVNLPSIENVKGRLKSVLTLEEAIRLRDEAYKASGFHKNHGKLKC